VIVWVLAGPRKKNNPCVQAVSGMLMLTNTFWPGAKVPLEGLKPIFPGTVVNATQCRLLWLLAREITSATQTYTPWFLQSRCPTKLIEEGRKSRIAGADGGEVGCGVTVGVGGAVGTCVAVGTRIAVADGEEVRVGVEVGALACPCAAGPQEARTSSAMARQNTKTTCLRYGSFSDQRRRDMGRGNLRCRIVRVILPESKASPASAGEWLWMVYFAGLRLHKQTAKERYWLELQELTRSEPVMGENGIRSLENRRRRSLLCFFLPLKLRFYPADSGMMSASHHASGTVMEKLRPERRGARYSYFWEGIIQTTQPSP